QSYLVKTETPKSPHTVASPTSLPDSTPPTRHAKESEGSDTSGARSNPSDFTTPLSPDHPLTHTTPILAPFLCRTAHMAVRVQPAMLPSLFVSIVEVAAMSDLAFCTSELVEDDDEEEDEEVEESLYSDSESEDTEEEGPIVEDEGPAAGDEGLVAREEGPGMIVESLGLGGDEAVPEEPERPERVSTLRQLILTTWIDPEDGRAYIDVPAYPSPAPPVQTPPSPK
ncbi:hypothetical protein Tco_1006242, partial [Tanacetum coccineum]